MSTTYKTVNKDTFASISRKVYGDDLQAFRIRSANAGAVEPFTAGVSLTIPDNQDAPKNATQRGGGGLSIFIEGSRFDSWDSAVITRSIDSMSTISFTAPFTSDDETFRRVFRPFSYRQADVLIDGEQLFSGTMVNVDPSIDEKSRRISVGCYSKPGVLSDCTPVTGVSELEFNELPLIEIVARLCAPYGISATLEADSGAPFTRVACESTKKIMSFLATLCAQRGLLMSDSPTGRIKIWAAVDAGKPVCTLRQGDSPLLSVSPKFNPQGYYASIAGAKAGTIYDQGGSFVLKNKHLEGVVRHGTVSMHDASSGDIVAAATSSIGRMFANMASFSVDVSTLRDPSGELWKPNTTIKVVAPDAMIYSEYEFLIKSVKFNVNGKSQTATLDLVFPEAYKQPKDPFDNISLTTPEKLPWD